MNENADYIIPEAEAPSPAPEPPPLPQPRKTRRPLAIAAGIIGLCLLAYWRFTVLKSLFFAVLPYGLVIIPSLIALGTIFFKDWDDYKSKWMRWMLVVLVVSACSIGIGYQVIQRQEKAATATLNQANIDGLQDQVAAVQKAQDDNTKQFLGSFKKLSDEVSALETKVATEELRAELAMVKGELQKTQAALAPPPKAKLNFSFAPFTNPPLGQPFTPVTAVTLPVEADGSVNVRFSVLNLTDVHAVDGELTLQICDQCRFAKEPASFTKLEGQSDTKRYMAFDRILAGVAFRILTADVIAPANAGSFTIAINYRCRTCVLNKASLRGIVHIRRGR